MATCLLELVKRTPQPPPMYQASSPAQHELSTLAEPRPSRTSLLAPQALSTLWCHQLVQATSTRPNAAKPPHWAPVRSGPLEATVHTTCSPANTMPPWHLHREEGPLQHLKPLLAPWPEPPEVLPLQAGCPSPLPSVGSPYAAPTGRGGTGQAAAQPGPVLVFTPSDTLTALPHTAGEAAALPLSDGSGTRRQQNKFVQILGRTINK